MKKWLFFFIFFSCGLSLLAGTITVTRPNASDNWVIGTTHDIQWTYAGFADPSAQTVVIRLWQGNQQVCMIAGGVPLTAGHYSWNLNPNACAGLVPGTYRVRVRIPQAELDDSDDFTISGQVQENITVTLPNGGESYICGGPLPIQWTSSGVSGNVKITLRKGGVNYLVIASSTPNDGSHSWPIPATVASGSNYRVRVENAAGTVWGESDGNFTITCEGPAGNKPDLYVKEMTVSPKPRDMGDTVHFKTEVVNGGGASSVACQATLKVAGPQGFQTLNYSFTIPALSPGQSTNVIKKDYLVPNWGFYKNTVNLDTDTKNTESNENNNEKSLTYTVNPLPDLIVTVRCGISGSLGNTQDIWADVENIGPASAPPSSLRFYVQGITGKEVTGHAIPQLDPGQKYTVKRNVRFLRTGKKRCEAIIDYQKQIKEVSENNKSTCYTKIHL